ncbi:MAG: hemolysin, partial [Methylocystis sp.]
MTITALDANGARVTTTFNWTVTNPALTARNDALTTGENATASGSVFANNGAGVDVDPDGDAFTVVAVTTGGTVNLPGDSVSGTNGGQFVINANGTFTFDPGTDFDSLPLGSSATTTVTYTIRDANGSESTATVTVTVNGANDGPAAVGTLPNLVNDDGDLVDVDVSGSFADPDGATVFTYALIGTAGVNYPAGLSILNGHIVGTIDRDASQNGPYRVTVQADDGAGSVITQTFTWVVDNPAPVAIDDTGATSENSAIVGADLTPATVGQDSDPDGDLLTVTEVNGIGFTGSTAVVGSGGGTFTINANGTYDFAPGTAFETLAQGVTKTTGVTYTISDGNGGTDTATVTV